MVLYFDTALGFCVYYSYVAFDCTKQYHYHNHNHEYCFSLYPRCTSPCNLRVIHPVPSLDPRRVPARRAKHGSDSETYDTEGRMVPQKLEETFSKYGDGSSLTGRQVWAATQGNRNVMDPFGWIAGKLEWGITWCVFCEAPSPESLNRKP